MMSKILTVSAVLTLSNLSVNNMKNEETPKWIIFCTVKAIAHDYGSKTLDDFLRLDVFHMFNIFRWLNAFYRLNVF